MDRIVAEGRAAQQQQEAEGPDYKSLSARIDKLELYAEQAGRQAELIEKLNDYVKALKDELNALYYIRIAAIGAAFLFILCLCGFTAASLFIEPRWVLHNHTHAVTALIVATVGASVALIALVLKGAFRSITDRNESDLLPENLKAAMEAVKTVGEAFGGKG